MSDFFIAESKVSGKLLAKVSKTIAKLQPIILQASQGTGKSFIANYIHRHSPLKNDRFVEVNGNDLINPKTQQIDEFNPNSFLEKGTLFLDNAHLLSASAWANLSQFIESTSTTNQEKDDTPQIRIILASPQKLNISPISAHYLKLPFLSQRRKDIPQLAQYFVKKHCQKIGRNPLQISQAVLRRLISYNYQGNITELESIIATAVWQTPVNEQIIPEKLFWALESSKNSFRIDLLNQFPWLRQFFLSKWFPSLFWWLGMAIFIPVTLLGFFGDQNRSHSLTLNFLWAWWWPFSLLLYPIIGRLWCSVCPFMVTGEWLRKLSLWIFPREQKSWQTKWLNRYGAWLMWGGFVLIYLWEKLWDLPHKAYLSAWLFLIITAGAVICSLIYERRLWCRYLCPIGAMNGMFAKLSMVELRGSEQVCGTQCDVFACQKGSEEKSVVTFAEALPNEGQEVSGCPLYSTPSTLTSNRDCVLCMGCVKGCPNRSIQLNLRFPASDLWLNHQPSQAEVALLLLLLGGVLMHYSHRFLSWFGIGNIALDSQHLLTAIPVVSLLLILPWLATYLTHKIAQYFDPLMPNYVTVIYAYLPLTLALNLVYYFPTAITETGSIFSVVAHNFGYGTAVLPSLTWSMDVASFLQQSTLFSLPFVSIYPLLKISKRSIIFILPHLILIIGFGVFFWQLI